MNISIDMCKKILKYAGIIVMVLALLTIGLGVASTFFGANFPNLQSGAELDEEAAKGVMALLFGGVSLIVSGIIDLITGFVSFKASKEAKFAKPAWILSIFSLLTSCFNAYKIIKTSGITASSIASAVVSVLISLLICYAAYRLNKHAEADGAENY